MKKEKLVVLIVGRQSELERLEIKEIFGPFEPGRIEDVDVIIFLKNKNVEIILCQTEQTSVRHDGDWRYIFQQQENVRKNKKEEIVSTFFLIKNVSVRNVLLRMSNFFNLILKI